MNFWWRVIGWISRRYFYMAVAPWILPVFGGLLISSNIGSNPSIVLICIGIVLIFVGAIPLGIREYHGEHVQSIEDEINAQERKCLTLIAKKLPQIPVSNSKARKDREEVRDGAITEVVDHLTDDVYSNIPEVRAVFYGLVEAEGADALMPVYFAGRNDEPKTHIQGSDRHESMMKLLMGTRETHCENGLDDRDYQSYVSASVSHGDDVYGLLTVDTLSDHKFQPSDELNLQLLARLVGAFFAGAERGRHAQ